MKGLLSNGFEFNLQRFAGSDDNPSDTDPQTTPGSTEPSGNPTDDDNPAAGIPQPPLPQEPVAGTASVDNGVDVVQGLYQLLQTYPDLADKIADVIEGYFVDNASGKSAQKRGNVNPAQLQRVPSTSATIGLGGVRQPDVTSLLTALEGRLSKLEKYQADTALDKELMEAKSLYESMKEHFPVLPDLNDKELLQIALQYDGLPLKEALNLWVMRKLTEGEGTVADRIVAAKMEQSKTQNLPKVEGKGGGIPAGTQEAPKNFREARKRAKEYLMSVISGPTNV